MSTLLIILLVGMSACSNSSSDVTSTENQSKSDNISQSTDDSSQSNDSSTANTVKSENGDDNGSGSTLSENSEASTGDKKDKGKLTQYSSEEIEYARVWLQLGPNQEIDELNIQHIAVGTPLNPGDEADVSYPEDVIQLAGSRLVDGVVTYSGNGDGTINVYNVPLRWYGGLSRPDNVSVDEIREEMKNIINNTKLVYVDTGDEERIIELIKLLNVHH
ncbi:hypothetical protein AA980_12945 [Neobacillus vireti]|nr:hypothetical protein AA980_12945 [Neobacillus vireti]